ncbi:MAG: YggS family pyridoxal phosphate-dependent enzyme, partial [Candidatus Thermoplasmatota archaeon]|nr:YggS family pyridoxal phosphate-dependent enzyme [Candidatus Thermoplasmatota archaeon]
ARKIAGQATLIHTLDSLRLAQKLSLIATEEGREIHALVQVNQGDEATKGGIAPEEVPKLVREAVTLQGLRITGLMSIPPFDNRPRDWFCQLRQLRDTVAEATGVALPQLSMGMSHDFAEAIAEGATLVRVGTAIFGARD